MSRQLNPAATLPTEANSAGVVKKNIVMLPGDGIGGEVLEAAEQVLRALPGLSFTFTEHPCGAGEFLRSGDPLPSATLEACRSADAILLGAMGLPDVRWPDGREMAPQLDLREQMGLFAGVRPVRVDAVMEALAALGANAPRDVLIEQVRGYGRQKTHLDFYEEGPCEGGFLPKVRLQFTVNAEQLEPAITALRSGARTGRIGDGKIFVHVVEGA